MGLAWRRVGHVADEGEHVGGVHLDRKHFRENVVVDELDHVVHAKDSVHLAPSGHALVISLILIVLRQRLGGVGLPEAWADVGTMDIRALSKHQATSSRSPRELASGPKPAGAPTGRRLAGRRTRR